MMTKSTTLLAVCAMAMMAMSAPMIEAKTYGYTRHYATEKSHYQDGYQNMGLWIALSGFLVASSLAFLFYITSLASVGVNLVTTASYGFIGWGIQTTIFVVGSLVLGFVAGAGTHGIWLTLAAYLISLGVIAWSYMQGSTTATWLSEYYVHSAMWSAYSILLGTYIVSVLIVFFVI